MKCIPFGVTLLIALLWFGAPAVCSLTDLSTAQAEFSEGKASDALKTIQKHLKTNPNNPQGLFLNALILERLGRFTEAMDVYRALIEAHPELPEPYNNLGALLAASGRFDEAKEVLQQAMSTHPSYATAHQNLSRIYSAMASSAYRRVLGNDDSKILVQLEPLEELELSGNTGLVHMAEKMQPQPPVPAPTPVLAKPALTPGAPQSALAPEPLRPTEDGAEDTDAFSQSRQSSGQAGLPLEGPPWLMTSQLCTPQELLTSVSPQAVPCPPEMKPAPATKSPEVPLSEAASAQSAAPRTERDAGPPSTVPTNLDPKTDPAPAAPIAPASDPEPEVAAVPRESAARPVQEEVRKPSGSRRDVQETVSTVVQGWAKAWANQNVEQYLSFYSAGFQPERGVNLATWRQQRRTRVAAPPFINVTLSDIHVDVLDEDSARVRFAQRYRSNVINDQVRKELLLRKENGHWRITRERLLPR